jgi:putative DNA primase/helicase
MTQNPMTAETIANALGGRKAGAYWIARCPAHDDRTPSLSIREGDGGKLLVHCHAGCEQAQVIAALRGRGLWPSVDRHCEKKIPQQMHQFAHDRTDRDDGERTARALRIWHEARPGAETIVAAYLRGRGISLDAWPASLRFHPACRRPKDFAGNLVPPLPAMVALVEHVQRGPVAIHRTFLRADGSGKAIVEPAKASLGPVGGGAVRFGMPRGGEWLAIAEGIETALSIATACAMPVWAALAEGGIRKLLLPAEATHVLLCADHDANGVGQRASHDAAQRFLREGRRVRIAMPPTSEMDFNDVLTSSGAAAIVEARHVA